MRYYCNKIYLPLFVFLFIFVFSVSSEGFIITETLRDSNSNSFIFGGNPTAFLTSGVKDGNTLIDPVGDGWLRLTKDTLFQRGYGYVKQSFSSTLGVQIDLEFKTWRTSDKYQGADGFSVFLFDATKTDTFQIGGWGGSLGYAQYYLKGNAENSTGLSNGYVGIGIAEFGNYSKGKTSTMTDTSAIKETEGRIGGDGYHENSIGVRGPAPDYEWITGAHNLKDSLEYNNTKITKRPADSVYYRRILVNITPGVGVDKDHYSIDVKMKTGKNNKFVSILSAYVLDSIPPAMLKLGFAASTGSAVNYHELRNLYITTPKGIRLTKQVDKLNATVGDTLTYTVDVYNMTDTLATNLDLADALDDLSKDNFEIDTVTFYNYGYVGNLAPKVDFSKDLSDVKISMEANSEVTFTIKGRIVGWPSADENSQHLMKNTATVTIDPLSGIIDEDLTNNTAIVTTIVTDAGLHAVNDVRKTGPDTDVNIDVLNNDIRSDSPYEFDSVRIITKPHGGVAEVNYSDGSILYNPDEKFSGLDTLTYRFADQKARVSDTALVIINVESKEIDIPNIFTPNGDVYNKVFYIKHLDYYPKSTLRICNRWGDEVYKNTDYNNDWDGSGLSEGTYYYTLILSDKSRKPYIYRGWVILKR